MNSRTSFIPRRKSPFSFGKKKNSFNAAGNGQTPPTWEPEEQGPPIWQGPTNQPQTKWNTRGPSGGSAEADYSRNRPGGPTYGGGTYGGQSTGVGSMPTATPPTGTPTSINPRQQPNIEIPGPPTWLPPTHQPPVGDGNYPTNVPGGGGGGGGGNWTNRVNFNPGHYQDWRPPDWATMSEEDRLAWSNSIRDINDPNFDQSWGELNDYFGGSMLSMLDPRSAQRLARTLENNRVGDQNFGVDIEDFWLNPAMGNYDQADANYLSADRGATARSFWDTALSDLMGGAGGMPTGDTTQTPLGGLQDLGNQVFGLMENYGTQPGQQRRNRFAEGRYQEELGGLLQSVQGTPMESFASILEALANPELFRSAASPTRFGMVQPPRR